MQVSLFVVAPCSPSQHWHQHAGRRGGGVAAHSCKRSSDSISWPAGRTSVHVTVLGGAGTATGYTGRSTASTASSTTSRGTGLCRCGPLRWSCTAAARSVPGRIGSGRWGLLGKRGGLGLWRGCWAGLELGGSGRGCIFALSGDDWLCWRGGRRRLTRTGNSGF